MSVFMDLKGTSQQTLQIQKGGAKLKNSSGVIQIRNAADSAYADLVANILRATGNSLVLNDDAAGSGADWKMNLARPASGMTAEVTYTLPAAPVNGQVLQTDASGNLSWVAQPSVSGAASFDNVTQAFGDTAKVLIAGTVGQDILVQSIVGCIKAVFDIDPLLSIGDETDADKFVLTTDYNLSTMSVGDVINIPLGNRCVTDENLEASFGASPTTGSIEWSIIYKKV